MSEKTVIFLGAGATCADGGPATSEILPQILKDREAPPEAASAVPDVAGRLIDLTSFLQEEFNVNSASPKEFFPALPLLMSLLDTALDRRQSFLRRWNFNRVLRLRQQVELGIFELLERVLSKAQTTTHYTLIDKMYPASVDPASSVEPCVITTNYDLLIDAAIMHLSLTRKPPDGGFPDYGCQIRTDFYREKAGRFGILLKLHGSLNWLYCWTCRHLELGPSKATKFRVALGRLAGAQLLENAYKRGSRCPTCKTRLRPLLIAPTHLKDYRNPHLMQVWHEAERVLRDASRVIFIGYSLPDDDVEVIYLLKRGLAHLTPDRITVVEKDDSQPSLAAHAVGRRYRTLFGDGLDWHPEGVGAWLPCAAALPSPSSAKASNRRRRNLRSGSVQG